MKEYGYCLASYINNRTEYFYGSIKKIEKILEIDSELQEKSLGVSLATMQIFKNLNELNAQIEEDKECYYVESEEDSDKIYFTNVDTSETEEYKYIGG